MKNIELLNPVKNKKAPCDCAHRAGWNLLFAHCRHSPPAWRWEMWNWGDVSHIQKIYDVYIYLYIYIYIYYNHIIYIIYNHIYIIIYNYLCIYIQYIHIHIFVYIWWDIFWLDRSRGFHLPLKKTAFFCPYLCIHMHVSIFWWELQYVWRY